MTVRALGRTLSYARPDRVGASNDDAAQDLLTSAVWYIDATTPGTQGATVPNLGTGGSALDATYGSTSGADTNDPLLLPHTGANYLYLASTAGNSVSCTAPASAASYAAYPRGGGSATTGAATGGAAFTFSTNGSWLRVDLLNGSAEVVASFNAANFTTGAATGLTDAYGVAWSINRPTSGRKSVAVVAPVWLFATDDYMAVADNDLLDFAADESFTTVVVFRYWPDAATDALLAKKNFTATAGYIVFMNSDGTVNSWQHDGTNVQSQNMLGAASGGLVTAAVVVDRATQVATLYALGGENSDDVTTVGSLANSNALRVGSGSPAGNYADTEFYAAAVFRRALTAGEAALVTAYFNARVGA